jgi:glyoxylase-like metal-dependent hydrolase (beta-lactamase superfamily II)/8-oxo-dGTP pyrophosphatase MutT (NUDIX family)
MANQVRQAAAIVLWRRDARGNVQVYLAKRSEHLAFFGGFWAFVGGSVEPTDGTALVTGAAVDAALVAAAARELFEETGIAALAGGACVAATHRDALRRQVQTKPAAWPAALQAQGLRVAGGDFVPFGRWQTPPFSPVTFDAQYFAVELPPGTSPNLWPGELTAGAWLTPQAALAHHDGGDMLLAYPVLATLRLLASCDNDVAAAAVQAQAEPDTLQRRSGPLVQGVRMLPLRSVTLPPATHTNCYILGSRELVVVDPGTPYAAEQGELLAYLEGLCSQGAKVREIWLTHAHPDHTGAAARLSTAFGVRIAAHADTRGVLAAGGDCTVDRTIADGDIVHWADDLHWQALHTPGHAPGHLCFYDPSRRHVLSGDNVLGLGSSIVAPSPHGSMRDYMASLARLLALPLNMLLPGHGPPVATPLATIRRYIAHRSQREAQIEAALTSVPQAAATLVAAVYTDVAASARPLALVSLQAHLEKLIFEKRAAALDGGFVRC